MQVCWTGNECKGTGALVPSVPANSSWIINTKKQLEENSGPIATGRVHADQVIYSGLE